MQNFNTTTFGSGTFVKCVAKSLGVVKLLIVILSISGCLSLEENLKNDVNQAPSLVNRQPFPSSRRIMPIEPAVVSYPNYKDPLIWINRKIFAFNDVTYIYLLIPLSKGYILVIPSPVRSCVSNFFYNIKTPIYAINHFIQLKPSLSGKNLLCFCINSTVGLFGLFDPAKAWFKLDRAETDFGYTLARYGAGYGIYLVLPIFGPTDLRNGTSKIVDHFLNPIIYLIDNPERTIIEGFDFFQDYAPNADQYEVLRKKTDDPYIFFRNLYLEGVQRDVDQ